MRITRRTALAALGLSATGAGVLLAPHDKASAAVSWGSLPKVNAAMTTGPVIRYRTGSHTDYDRFVVDVGRGRGTLGYSVQYVSRAAGLGSGMTGPVAGGAVLQILAHAPANARTVFPPAAGQTFSGYRTFRQLKSLGSFEGDTGYALGVRARLPMRVMVLVAADGTRRLVIDVAHHW